ncbi:MAG: alpha/beta hydrolase [Pseudomonadota bacterium]
MLLTPAVTTAAATMTGALLINARAAARERAIEARHPPEGVLLDIDGVQVHAVVRGSGPDLVLLHGASGNCRDFTFSLMDRLAPRYRVIALDRPGLGYTGRTDPAYASAFTDRAETPAEQARLMKAAAARLGAGAPLVLGHSFGGTIALAWALEGGPRALILLGAPAMEWPGGLGPIYTITGSAMGGAMLIPTLTATLSEAHIRKIVDRTFRPNQPPPGYDDHLGPLLTLRRASLRANGRQVNNLKPQIIEMQKRYADLTLPIEWVHGVQDETVPADIHAHPFKALVPQTNLTLLDGVGHMPHHDDEPTAIAAIDRAAARA